VTETHQIRSLLRVSLNCEPAQDDAYLTLGAYMGLELVSHHPYTYHYYRTDISQQYVNTRHIYGDLTCAHQ